MILSHSPWVPIQIHRMPSGTSIPARTDHRSRNQAIQLSGVRVNFDLRIPGFPVLFQEPLTKFGEFLAGKPPNLFLDFLEFSHTSPHGRVYLRDQLSFSPSSIARLPLGRTALTPFENQGIPFHGASSFCVY